VRVVRVVRVVHVVTRVVSNGEAGMYANGNGWWNREKVRR